MATINSIGKWKLADEIEITAGTKPFYGWVEVNVPVSRISYYDDNREISVMKNWCKDNVGEKAKDWTLLPRVTGGHVLFKFKNAADATFFSLKFSK